MTGQQSPPKPVGAGGWDSRWRITAICVGLAAITAVVFGRTLGNGFVNFDDGQYVYGNPEVIAGLTRQGIAWAFTTTHGFNWHPLTWLSHMLDCQLYGSNPAGHHLTSVLLHTATVILLFLVLRQMTGALWRSALVAAFFAVHPLRVESVAWVAERKDVLSGLFFMLTIGAYVRYARRPWSLCRYGLVAFLFALGLMCKPMLVTLPVVLLLLDYWPLQRKESMGKLALEKLPLLVLSAGGCVATLLAQNKVVQWSGLFPLPLRLANALVTCMVYLWQMIWPADLAVYYPFPRNGILWWEVALAGMLLAGLSTVAFRLRRKKPWLLVGWLWYLIMLLPVVGIIQVGWQAHADRYTYLPQIGILVALTWLAAEWRVSRMALGVVITGALAMLMACAWKQAGYWKDSETLWVHALACTTDNDMAHYNLGNILYEEGFVDDAIAQFQKELAINPNYAYGEVNLGTALGRKGKVDEAITHYQKALQIKPDCADAHYNLGNAFVQKGKVGEAITHFQETLQIEPDSPAVQNELAWLLATGADASLRNGRKAVELARQANALTGRENPAFLQTLAAALAETGRFSDATETAQRALRLAGTQSNTNLSGQLQSEMKLYQAGSPFHVPARAH